MTYYGYVHSILSYYLCDSVTVTHKREVGKEKYLNSKVLWFNQDVQLCLTHTMPEEDGILWFEMYYIVCYNNHT